MQTMETQYLQLLHDVLLNGQDNMDRTGTGTRKVFARQLRCHLSQGFPAITTKQLFWKPMLGELLWFLAGSSDNKELARITFGDETRRTIWSPNANDPGLPSSPNTWLTNPNRKGEDDVGRVYGVQWREWESHTLISYTDTIEHLDMSTVTYTGAKVQVRKYDQVAKLVESLKTNDQNRRMIITAFNVGEIEKMALPPCHMMAQFDVSPGTNELNCQVYIRSNDLFLGLPFNIASYALLTHMLAQITGKKVGELIITIGDAHIYLNHIDQVKEQLTRTPFNAPTLVMNTAVTDLNAFSMDDFDLKDYLHHPAIKAPIAV